MSKVSKLYWFGDSWCEGVPGGGEPFPNLVSNYLNIPHENRGESGSCVTDMVDSFLKIKENLKSTDVVICCLTSSNRVTWISEQNKKVVFGVSKFNKKAKIWLTEFANDNFTSYLMHHSINTLYYMCLSMGVRIFFVNSFSNLARTNMLTPDNIWLLPATENIANYILKLPIIAPEIEIKDQHVFTIDQWQTQRSILNTYFLPNDGHPNELGNKKIAEQLTILLENKLWHQGII